MGIKAKVRSAVKAVEKKTGIDFPDEQIGSAVSKAASKGNIEKAKVVVHKVANKENLEKAAGAVKKVATKENLDKAAGVVKRWRLKRISTELPE